LKKQFDKPKKREIVAYHAIALANLAGFLQESDQIKNFKRN
jgi:hypothetical protein